MRRDVARLIARALYQPHSQRFGVIALASVLEVKISSIEYWVKGNRYKTEYRTNSKTKTLDERADSFQRRKLSHEDYPLYMGGSIDGNQHIQPHADLDFQEWDFESL